MKFHVGSRKSKILRFDGYLLSKLYKVLAKKDIKELSLVTLKSDLKFTEKLASGFKFDIGNLVNFQPTSQKSEHFLTWAPFAQYIQGFSHKNIEELSFITLDNGENFE